MILLIVAMCSLFQNNSPYRDWHEDKISNYNGVYTTFDFSKYSSSDKYLVKELEIIVENNEIAVTYNFYSSKDLEESNYETLKNPSINGNHFGAIGSKSFQFKSLKGKFVLKSPPNNAKGPIEKGLLLNGKFYLKK